MASRNKDLSIIQYTIKRFRQVMVPYFFYGIVAMVTILIANARHNPSVGNMLRQLLIGMRTDSYAVTLWFLPCIFLLGIYYQLLIKLFSNKWVRFAVCIFISFVFRLFSEGNMLPWGADNAVRFLIYYAAGDTFADILNKFSLQPALIWKKIWPAAFMLIALFCSYIHYHHGYTYFTDRLGIPPVYLVLVLMSCFYAFVGIFLFSAISILIQNIKPLQFIGQASLVICCMQVPVDRFVYYIASLLKINIPSDTQFQCLVIAAVFTIIGTVSAVFIKKYLPFTLGIKAKKQ